MHDHDLVREIGEEVQSHRELLVGLCGRLVAAGSVNPPGDTTAMADVVLTFLSGQGVPAERLSEDEQAPNVVSTIAADKPGAHVVFNAHMDTMHPGPLSSWSVPVLEMTKRDGRLYGLGMGNMKGGLAAMALAMKVVQRRLPSCEITPTMLTGQTDAQDFSRLGIKTYGFSPLLLKPGEDFADLYHAPNERVSIDGLKTGLTWLTDVVDDFCGAT